MGLELGLGLGLGSCTSVGVVGVVGAGKVAEVGGERGGDGDG